MRREQSYRQFYYKIDNCHYIHASTQSQENGNIGHSTTVVPVFSGLCDQGTPAVSGQYNDVRGDFQFKLTRDQGTPANADRHLFVIFSPQPGDSALFILFFITLGRKRYQIPLLMRIISLKRMSNRLPQLRTPNNNDASRRCASWEK